MIFRNGQWVKFALDLEIGRSHVILGDQVVLLDDELWTQIEARLPRLRTLASGRHVGIFVRGGRFQDGKGGFKILPDCIAPQRELIGPGGSQNLAVIHEGRVCTLLLTASGFTDAEPITARKDLPAYRDETSHPDWQPTA